MIVHPAYAVLQEKKVEAGGNKTKEMEARREYTETVIDRFVASFSWAFVKGLRMGVEESGQTKPWTSKKEGL